jgi:hypothetical protein
MAEEWMDEKTMIALARGAQVRERVCMEEGDK